MFNLCVLQHLAFSKVPLELVVPGDVNFDPLHLATKSFGIYKTPDERMYSYREAELKHGRLAMLAAVAYPAQEVVNPVLAKALHLPNELANSNLSPSLVNGNLDPSVLIAFLGFASALELYKMNQSTQTPGDYNWRVTSVEEGTREFFDLQEGEVWNGRIAMIATLGYVVQEAVLKTPVLFNV